jgi:hypothetical protein
LLRPEENWGVFYFCDIADTAKIKTPQFPSGMGKELLFMNVMGY